MESDSCTPCTFLDPVARDMRAVVSVEAASPDSVRWYADEVLRLREHHPAWQDMERQLGRAGNRPGREG